MLDRKCVWKLRTPPSPSHIAKESHCTLWCLSIVELSTLGAALTDKGKPSLQWGCAVDCSPHLASWEELPACRRAGSLRAWFEFLSSPFSTKFSSVAVFATPCLLGSPQKMQANTHQLLSVVCSASEGFLQNLVVVVVSLSVTKHFCMLLLFFHNKSFNHFFIIGTTYTYRPKLWFRSTNWICRLSSVLV